uniref:Protein DIS3 homolog n=2 Tax=Meloidogyne TaxID=189290 RepID=A0A914KMQ1_MELIC
MELNVKQSGIEKRTFSTTYYKTRSGKINKRVNELYLRNDIPCGFSRCLKCRYNSESLKPLQFFENGSLSKSVKYPHFLLLDGPSIMKFIDVLDDISVFRNIIILQSVWVYIKKMSGAVFKRLNTLFTENNDRMFVFLNEFVGQTFVDPSFSRVPELYQEQCLISGSKFLRDHWNEFSVRPLILCSSEEAVARVSKDYSHVISIIDYVKGIPGSESLIQRLTDLNKKERRGRALFPEYWTQDKLLDGLSKGNLKKGKFQISPENYLEAFVEFDMEDQWFVQGSLNMNRAVHGDVVVAQLLPESEWTAPEKTIRLRDAEETQNEGDNLPDADGEEEEEDGEDLEDSEAPAKKSRKEVLPSARIVGILRRNWRHYCGIILPPNMPGARQFLFAPSERLIPRIRIETSYYEQLIGKKVLVQIDSWPQDSHYPRGHYIRVIGNEGERKTEDEVILLEHEVPYDEFSPAVLACLPEIPWSPHPLDPPEREDLTSLDICSVDPEGCTDIDDAVHCRELRPNRFEVGVHIADVTHFVRPGTAIDQTAAERSTTVYLCGRRIDMLPSLLSTNLCSLRGGELRYAFSVIWELNGDAEIQNVKFCKSLIHSRAALTYQKAQEMIDDQKYQDVIATSLRNLLNLSKKLKSRRRTVGALELASSEIRFDINPETGAPVKVLEKQHLETMSMIEEFMLLANISVAEKILYEYPDCAILRRHPIPGRVSFKPLISMAESCGFHLNVDTGKELGKSLDEIEKLSKQGETSRNVMVARMLRMLATRCMTQAVYFAAGTVPRDQYLHYGLAVQVYTHFTSPIRRYADVMVHRLLAALIGVDQIHPNMLDRRKLIRQTENMNRRHRRAQYASRASVLLNTFMMVKETPEPCLPAIVIGIRSNGIQVMIPKFGLESVIYLNENTETSTTSITKRKERKTIEQMSEFCSKNGIRLFQQIKVSLNVIQRKDQRRRIDVRLVEPCIEGFSIVTNCEPEMAN